MSHKEIKIKLAKNKTVDDILRWLILFVILSFTVTSSIYLFTEGIVLSIFFTLSISLLFAIILLFVFRHFSVKTILIKGNFLLRLNSREGENSIYGAHDLGYRENYIVDENGEFEIHNSEAIKLFKLKLHDDLEIKDLGRTEHPWQTFKSLIEIFH